MLRAVTIWIGCMIIFFLTAVLMATSPISP